MNIHFDDTKLFKQLDLNTIARFTVGSHMYKLNTHESDNDYLLIYCEAPKNLASFLWEHHQLQYKMKNKDYNFTSLQNFIRNTITGDSTINFEVLFTDEIKNTPLSYLSTLRDNFITYNIIKSYLGMAKRDYKRYLQTNKDNKKLYHFVRGVISAKELLEENYLDVKYSKHWELLYDIRENKLSIEDKQEIECEYFILMNSLRSTLNYNFENGKINRVPSLEVLNKIDSFVKETTLSLNFDSEIEYGSLFYSVLGQDIKY